MTSISRGFWTKLPLNALAQEILRVALEEGRL